MHDHAKSAPEARPTLAEVAQLVGGDDPSVHMAVLATGATYAEIEAAVAAAAGVDEAFGGAPLPLAGRAAAVYEIITAEPEEPE